MANYRKKPVIIQAIQWTGENRGEVLNFANSGPAPSWGGDFVVDRASKEVVITTLEGQMRAGVGDWIIRGVQGEYYPCKAVIFEMTYEQVAPQIPS